MRKSISSPYWACMAFALLLSATDSARADLISWTYNWEPSSAKIAADGGGSGWIGLTNEPSKSSAGSSNTVITNLRTFSTALQSTPDMFNHAAYTFTLNLRDNASQATGSLNFSGFFSGTLTDSSANIKNAITSPTTQALTLGGNTYTVSLGNYTPPGPPGATNAGSLNAFVTVTPGSGGGGVVSGVPEPSTLSLAALAFPCAGVLGWRRRKKGMTAQQSPRL
ncbi:MAG TPA: PEP-CTERM sorting domain-containing protein [Gemmataceae bacterium]|jgi:hypothetical protein